jgi:fluoride ion exporter CrcB/FEX
VNNLTQMHASKFSNIKKTRKWFVISFIAAYFFLFVTYAFREIDPYYYVSFFPYGLLQVLTILSAISFSVFSYRLSSLLEKKTYVIVIFTILSPFFLINFIPFIGILADSRKFINTVSKRNKNLTPMKKIGY